MLSFFAACMYDISLSLQTFLDTDMIPVFVDCYLSVQAWTYKMRHSSHVTVVGANDLSIVNALLLRWPGRTNYVI